MGGPAVLGVSAQSRFSTLRRDASGRTRVVAVRAATQPIKVGGTRVLKPAGREEGGTQKSSGNFLEMLKQQGTQMLKAGSAASPAKGGGKRDPNTVFVAGATGRLGARVIRQLLNDGFTVRAAARDVESAQATVKLATQYGLLAPATLAKLQVVEFDLLDADGMAAAIGNAGRVVCTVGAAESSLNPNGPKTIDGAGTIALVNAAAAAGVEQFVLVTSLGTGKIGFPASVLNLFFGILSYKREAEKALEASGMSYLIVRPGGMERPTDTYKETYGVVLSPRDTKFGGMVSRLQVAELVGAALRNPALAENKVLEVTAEVAAFPQPSFEELLGGIDSDFSREEQLTSKAEADAAAATLADAQGRADAARAALEDADERVAEISDRVKQAKSMEIGVKGQAGPALRGAQAAQKQLADAKAAASKAALLESAAKAVLEAAKKAAAQGQVLSDKDKAAIRAQVMNPPAAQQAGSAAPAAAPAGGFFGGFGTKVVKAAPPPPAQSEAKEAPAKAAKAPANFFASLIKPAASAEEEDEEEEEEEAAPPPPAAAAKKQQAAVPAKQAAAPAPAKPAAPKAPASGGNFFTNLLGLTPAVDAEEEEEEEVVEEKAPVARQPKAAAAAAPKAPAPEYLNPPSVAQRRAAFEERERAANEAAQKAEADRLARSQAAWRQDEIEREAAAVAKAAAMAKQQAEEKIAAARAKEEAEVAARAQAVAQAKAEGEAQAKRKAEETAAAAKAKDDAEKKAVADKAAAEKKAAVPPAAAASSGGSSGSNGASAPGSSVSEQKAAVQKWIAEYRARTPPAK